MSSNYSRNFPNRDGRGGRSPQDDCRQEKEALEKQKSQIFKFYEADRPDDLLDAIKAYVKCMVNGVSTSQLRNLFDLVRKQTNWKDLQRQRPKFAYAQARMSNKKGKDFIGFLESLMAEIKDDDGDKVKNFKGFFEAVVAYHKFEESNKKIKSEQQ